MSKGLPPTSLVIEWSPRLVTAYDGQTRATQTAGTLQELTGVSGRETVIAVSRRAVFVRATRVPNATPEDIRLAVQVRLGDLFPVAATELAFDVALTNDVTSEGRLAIVAAMPSGELKRLLDDARSAGLKVRKTIPAAVGSALLAQGLGRTDAAVVQPVEGGLAIDVIAEGFVRASRVVPTTLHPAAEVSRTYSLTGLACAPLISGGGIALDEADVRSDGNALTAIAATPTDSLVLNLEPPEKTAQRAKSARDRNLIFTSLALVCALAFAGFEAYTYANANNAVQAVVDKNAVDIIAMTKKEADASSELKKSQATAATITAAFLPAQTMADMISEISDQVGPDVWLTGITGTRGKPFQIRGTAKTSDSVYAYLNRLKAVNRLRNVQLVFANTGAIDQTTVVNFSLSAVAIGNLPLLDSSKKSS